MDVEDVSGWYGYSISRFCVEWRPDSQSSTPSPESDDFRDRVISPLIKPRRMFGARLLHLLGRWQSDIPLPHHLLASLSAVALQ